MAEIVFKNVCKDYGDLRAVDRMNLAIGDGEFFVLLGPSGAGKTSTLKMVAGVEQVSEGTISIDGRVINDLLPEERNTAMVFESYALYSHLSVYENIAFPLKAPGRERIPKAEIDGRVRRTSELLRIEELLQRVPGQLSGGQRQRVALGRALVREPSVFLMDEPLSHLDAKIRHRMRAELKNLSETINTTIVYVTHDYNEALALGDRIAILDRGKIMQVGTPEEIYQRPLHRLVAESVGDPSMNFLHCKPAESAGEIGLSGIKGDFFLPLEPGMQTRLRAQLEKEVFLGIRPRDVVVSRSDDGGCLVAGKVFVQETLGDEDLLEVTIGDTLFTVLTELNESYALDETVYLNWDMNAAHLFNRETGVSLLSGRSSDGRQRSGTTVG
ncbi:ABC transporter ATP-binding protein [candidate division KSB1 bacterium]